MSNTDAIDATKCDLHALAADPVHRRQYLMRQSIYCAFAREQEIT